MTLSKRINDMIEEAYAKGQTTVSTTLQGFEMFEQDEIDELITDLRARGFRVTHDDVFNDMSIRLPDLSFAERARLIAYNVDSATKKHIESIMKEIVQSSRYGYIEMDRDFFNLSDDQIIEDIHAHFSREGFNVVRMDNPKNASSRLTIRWNK